MFECLSATFISIRRLPCVVTVSQRALLHLIAEENGHWVMIAMRRRRAHIQAWSHQNFSPVTKQVKKIQKTEDDAIPLPDPFPLPKHYRSDVEVALKSQKMTTETRSCFILAVASAMLRYKWYPSRDDYVCIAHAVFKPVLVFEIAYWNTSCTWVKNNGTSWPSLYVCFRVLPPPALYILDRFSLMLTHPPAHAMN